MLCVLGRSAYLDSVCAYDKKQWWLSNVVFTFKLTLESIWNLALICIMKMTSYDLGFIIRNDSLVISYLHKKFGRIWTCGCWDMKQREILKLCACALWTSCGIHDGIFRQSTCVSTKVQLTPWILNVIFNLKIAVKDFKCWQIKMAKRNTKTRLGSNSRPFGYEADALPI